MHWLFDPFEMSWRVPEIQGLRPPVWPTELYGLAVALLITTLCLIAGGLRARLATRRVHGYWLFSWPALACAIAVACVCVATMAVCYVKLQGWPTYGYEGNIPVAQARLVQVQRVLWFKDWLALLALTMAAAAMAVMRWRPRASLRARRITYAALALVGVAAAIGGVIITP